MLIKSVIKAGTRRFIIVILHLTNEPVKCSILLIINALGVVCEKYAETEPIPVWPQKNKL